MIDRKQINRLTRDICSQAGVLDNVEILMTVNGIITDFMKDGGAAEIFKNGLSSYIFGKPERESEEMEIRLIGCLVTDCSRVYPKISSFITDECFYYPIHSEVFSVIKNMAESGTVVNLTTLTERLKNIEHDSTQSKLEWIGGEFYLSTYQTGIVSTEDAEDCAKMIASLKMLREISRISRESIDKSFSVDDSEANDLRDQIMTALSNLSKLIFDLNTVDSGSEMAEMLQEHLTKLREIQEARERGEVIFTGKVGPLEDMNELTSGYQPGDLIIWAARPGMGKTARMIGEVIYAAFILKEPCLIFSLEMPKLQLVLRMLAALEGIDYQKLKKAKLEQEDWVRITVFIEKLEAVKIYIDDSAGVNWKQIRDKAIQSKEKYGIERVYVDYLQLMGPEYDKQSTYEKVGKSAYGMKELAKIINKPVFLLSQLSRAVETRGGTKRPMLQDMRESGLIEEAADIVEFIYRPEYYHILEDEEGYSLVGLAEHIIAKNRSGPLDTVKSWYHSEEMSFKNLSERPIDYTNTTVENHTRIEDEETSMGHPMDDGEPDDDLPF